MELYVLDDTGAGEPLPRWNGGAYSAGESRSQAATGEPTTLWPTNDDPEDGRTRPVVMLLPGRHWFTVDTTTQGPPAG